MKLSLEEWDGPGEPRSAEWSAVLEATGAELTCLAVHATPKDLSLGEGFRGMSQRLIECPLVQWLWWLDQLDVTRLSGKTTLHRYTHWLETELLERVVTGLLAVGGVRSRRGSNADDKGQLNYPCPCENPPVPPPANAAAAGVI